MLLSTDPHTLNSDQKRRPTAAQLLGHPYLELDDDWVFPGMQNLGEPPSAIATEGSEIAVIHSQSDGIHSTSSTVRPRSPALTMQSGTLGPSEFREHHSHFSPRPKSPPLVTIAPPPPRKPSTQGTGNSFDWTQRSRSSSGTGSESSTSQISSQHSSTTRSRKLVVHNPDHDSDFTKAKGKEKASPTKPFIYTPPPLPDVNGSVYSNSLAPVPATRFGSTPNLNASHYPGGSSGRHHSASPSALQAPARYSKAGPANMKAVMASRSESVDDSTNYSSDSDSNKTSSTWQVRPRDTINARLPRLPLPLAPTRRLDQHRVTSIAENSRPNSHQVLAHLDTYFRDHNLDEKVETPVEPEFQPNRPGSVARRKVLKSIKTVAAEIISKDMTSPVRRRQTLLWDRPTEEIKPPQPT
jgi:hypothetical protein